MSDFNESPATFKAPLFKEYASIRKVSSSIQGTRSIILTSRPDSKVRSFNFGPKTFNSGFTNLDETSETVMVSSYTL